LETKGYRLLDAGSGRAAISLCQSYVGPIHLLVVNEINDMSAPMLANQALLFRPEMRILLVLENEAESGFSFFAHHSQEHRLDRPLRLEVLAAKVRSVLDAPASVSLH
jgi:hypothetical protein